MDSSFSWLEILFFLGIAGSLLYQLLIWDWFYLGYFVVDKSIQVRLLHLLPIWRIPISNISELSVFRRGWLSDSAFGHILGPDFVRPYVHLRLKRGLFRSLTITPMRPERFIADVRRHMP